MKNISLLQQTSLVVGNAFIFHIAIQSLWNNRIIKNMSVSLSFAGAMIGVIAITAAIFRSMLLYSTQDSKQIPKESTDRLFRWLKEGFILLTISWVGLSWS